MSVIMVINPCPRRILVEKEYKSKDFNKVWNLKVIQQIIYEKSKVTRPFVYLLINSFLKRV